MKTKHSPLSKLKKVLTSFFLYLKHNPYLLLLFGFIVLLRLPVLLDQMIPFQFDHGKDAIGSLHMWLTKSPKLIGPWTSIPGLFFGPAWYYLLLPGMVLSQGSPVASVVTMVILGLVTVGITYRYFGKIAATLLATSSLFYTITTSAWNPFPMVCVSLIILATLKEVEVSRKLSVRSALLLGFFAALGFHFSTAFAIFYPVLITLSLLLKKIKVKMKTMAAALLSFIIPFVPQILFELKHNFIEVKAVLAYLEQGDSDRASLQKLANVLTITWGELRQVLIPPTYFFSSLANTIITFIFVSLLIVALYFFLKKLKNVRTPLLIDALLWFTLPVLAFVFLHYNLWYVLPLAAFTYVLLAQVLQAAPKQIKYTFLVLCFVAAFSKLFFYLGQDKLSLKNGTTFLPNKNQAISYIYQQAGGKSFASYHYMPDIYDYPYQYLYFIEALKGQKLPTEFSYKPGEVAYIPEKAELLDYFSARLDGKSPELIFYIVEESNNSDLLERWWSEQRYQEIVHEQAISDVLTVYTATPLTTN